MKYVINLLGKFCKSAEVELNEARIFLKEDVSRTLVSK